MTDAPQEYDDYPAEGGRRRAQRRRSLPGCLAVVVALAVVAGPGVRRRDQGCRVGLRPVRRARRLRRSRHRQGELRGERGRQRGRHLPQPQERRPSSRPSTPASRPRGPTPSRRRIQVGLLRGQEGDGVRRRDRGPGRPGQPGEEHRDHPRGPPRRGHGRRPRREHRLLEGASTRRRSRTPRRSGCRTYANGNPEGYLFPSTYDDRPRRRRPSRILAGMVDRWEQAAEDADLEAKAEELGYTPAELMTIASLVEAEGRGDDMPKVARVIYNRLETGDETNGLLADRRHRQLRRRQRARRRADRGRPRAGLAVQHLPERRACRRRRSRRPATPPSRRRPTRPTATGTTTSPSTSRPARPSSPRPTTSSWSTSRSCRTTARTSPKAPAEVAMRCAVLGDPIAHSLSPALHRAGYAERRPRLALRRPPGGVRRTARRSWPGSTSRGAACR